MALTGDASSVISRIAVVELSDRDSEGVQNGEVLVRIVYLALLLLEL